MNVRIFNWFLRVTWKPLQGPLHTLERLSEISDHVFSQDIQRKLQIRCVYDDVRFQSEKSGCLKCYVLFLKAKKRFLQHLLEVNANIYELNNRCRFSPETCSNRWSATTSRCMLRRWQTSCRGGVWCRQRALDPKHVECNLKNKRLLFDMNESGNRFAEIIYIASHFWNSKKTVIIIRLSESGYHFSGAV